MTELNKMKTDLNEKLYPSVSKKSTDDQNDTKDKRKQLDEPTKQRIIDDINKYEWTDKEKEELLTYISLN